MTPLALEMMRSLLEGRREDRSSMLTLLSDIHCFEVSDILDVAREMAGDIRRKGLSDDFMFLPGPKTWIEFSESDFSEVLGKVRLRTAYMIEERQSHFHVEEVHGCSGHWRREGSFKIRKREIQALTGFHLRKEILSDFEDGTGISCRSHLILILLAFINTPRIIGRRQHMPHRGLERRLLRDRGNIGKFPLQAWTEIRLAVTAPNDMTDENSVEAHYTGSRALHFCRAHIRVRLGRLELVRGHWRGDASLGIKRSRYKLVAQG